MTGLACRPPRRRGPRPRGSGSKLATLDDCPQLDLTVDGADEFDDALRLIKGGGGALLREKIVAAASERMIVIADAGKRVKTLGAFPLPVEIDRFGAQGDAAACRGGGARTWAARRNQRSARKSARPSSPTAGI